MGKKQGKAICTKIQKKFKLKLPIQLLWPVTNWISPNLYLNNPTTKARESLFLSPILIEGKAICKRKIQFYKLQMLIEFLPEAIRQLVQRLSDAWVCLSRGRDAGPPLDVESPESVTPTTRSGRKQKWRHKISTKPLLIKLTDWKH